MNADLKRHSGANIYHKKRSCFVFFAVNKNSLFMDELQDVTGL